MPLRLLKGIRHFKNNQFKEKEAVFTALSQGQAPDVLFFGCIDSRIDLRLITNAQLGELLVARNPGNIVPPFSSNPSGEASSSEFALEHLNVSEIIVCGHSHCGAMKGLMTPGIEKTLPNTANWLNHAKDALEHVHQHHPELDDDPEQKLKCLTQNNVLLQIEHLKTHPAVAKGLAEGKLKIHGWYYEFEKGEIYIYNSTKKAFIAFEETVDEIAQKQLKQIVETEALDYLTHLTPQNPFKHFSYLKSNPEQIEVKLIWDGIKNKVRKKAIDELGELYLTSTGTLSPQFNKLLDKSPFVLIPRPNNQYQQLEQLFNETLLIKSKSQQTEKQKALLKAIEKLKNHTLNCFANKEKQFDFTNCMLLAKGVKDFNDKLINKTASASDIEQFKTLSKNFKPNASSAILTSILASIAALATALIGGFIIGNPLGGVAAGITIIAALNLGLWARKDPIKQFIKTAEKIHENHEEQPVRLCKICA